MIASDFVMDASFTVPWVFRDEANALSDEAWAALVTGKVVAHVPGLWTLEMANVTVRGSRASRDRPSEEETAMFFAVLKKMPLRIHHQGPETAFERVPAIMRKHGLTAYDSSYLLLALVTGHPLATLDEKLRKAAIAEGVELVA